MRLEGVTLVSLKNKNPAYVSPTSLNIPVMFIEIGPLIVTQRRAVMVMRIPKLPEIRM